MAFLCLNSDRRQPKRANPRGTNVILQLPCNHYAPSWINSPRVGMKEFSKSPHMGSGLQIVLWANSPVRTCGNAFFAASPTEHNHCAKEIPHARACAENVMRHATHVWSGLKPSSDYRAQVLDSACVTRAHVRDPWAGTFLRGWATRPWGS
jgi:hypothetical protein